VRIPAVRARNVVDTERNLRCARERGERLRFDRFMRSIVWTPVQGTLRLAAAAAMRE
jgi:hypothetical protein